MNLFSKIQHLNLQFETEKNRAKRLGLINDIIEIKNILQTDNSQLNIYKDIKLLIVCYLDTIEEEKYGYDFVNLEHILTKFEYLCIEQQIPVLIFLRKELYKRGYLSEAIEINKKHLRAYLKQIISKKEIKKLPKLLFFVSSYNLLTLLISLFLFIFFCSTLLLSAPTKHLEFFMVDITHYTKIEILDIFLNMSCFFLGFEQGFSIQPLNIFGVFILIFIKGFYFLVIVNYIIKEIENRFMDRN